MRRDEKYKSLLQEVIKALAFDHGNTPPPSISKWKTLISIVMDTWETKLTYFTWRRKKHVSLEGLYTSYIKYCILAYFYSCLLGCFNGQYGNSLDATFRWYKVRCLDFESKPRVYVRSSCAYNIDPSGRQRWIVTRSPDTCTQLLSIRYLVTCTVYTGYRGTNNGLTARAPNMRANQALSLI